jgi:hypothetical protein
MSYLNYDLLDAIDGAAFRNRKPYPWLNPEGALTEIAYRELREHLPDVSLFDKYFGVRRAHGQQSHDRFVLEYRDGLDLPRPWQELIAELRGDRYQGFLRRICGVRSLDLNFHWHYTPTGCSVSPHCDARHKLGSHIFYFNTEQDWDPSWGGETLILDDRGRFERRSAPGFEDFDRTIASQALGNRSLIFMQAKNSWHGVREVRCPQGRMRKVFIAVINRAGPIARVRRFLRHAA